MLYRVLKKLDRGSRIIPQGSILRAREWPSEILRALERVNAIAPIATPPLEVLPSLSEFASALRELEILTVEDLLEVDPERIPLLESILSRKYFDLCHEITEWLSPSQPESSG